MRRTSLRSALDWLETEGPRFNLHPVWAEGRLWAGDEYKQIVPLVPGVSAVVRRRRALIDPTNPEALRQAIKQRLMRTERCAIHRLKEAREISRKMREKSNEEYWAPIVDEWNHDDEAPRISMAGAYDD